MLRNLRCVTNRDHIRLTALVDELQDAASSARLDEALASCRTVPSEAAPKDLVTMNSVVRVRIDGGASRVMTLVYPHDADASIGRISVIAPLGLELLGRSLGESVAWRGADGVTRHLVIEEVVYQPEACGDLYL